MIQHVAGATAFRGVMRRYPPDQKTYGGGEHGYVDYPFADAVLQSTSA